MPLSTNMGANADSAHLKWWAERLRDQTVSPLTRDYPEPSSENAARRPIEAVESLQASENVKAALSSLSPHGTASNIVLTALVILVSRLTGDEDISIGANAEP